MKYELGVKSYSDFQKLLNQWTTTGVEFKILKVEFIDNMVHYMLKKETK